MLPEAVPSTVVTALAGALTIAIPAANAAKIVFFIKAPKPY